MQRGSKLVSDEVGGASVGKKVMAILGHTIIIYFFISLLLWWTIHESLNIREYAM